MPKKIREAILKKQPLTPIVHDFLTQPIKKANPLLSWALRVWDEKELVDMISSALRSHLPRLIRKHQEILQLLNSKQGREFLHKNLDALLDYLTSETYRGTAPHRCPSCQKRFRGTMWVCPFCNAELTWK